MKTIFPFILFSLFIALALIPLASAQIDLQGGVQSLTDGLSNLWGQASTFVSEQPLATGVIGTGAAGTGICAGGWKLASKAKNKLQTAYNSVSGQVEGLQQKADSATEQLKNYQTQAQTQLSAAQQQAKAATDQLSGVQSKLETVTQQKASYQNQIEELQARLKTATDQLAVLTPKVK